MTIHHKTLRDTHIRLAHGNGGRAMHELIENLVKPCLYNSLLDTDDDAATLPWQDDKLVVTTDSFTVSPIEFPGGDIGKLAVCGSVNDLVVCGAKPLYLSLALVLEEGLEISLLERCLQSFAAEARQTGVRVVTGDTKVVPRGQGGGMYFNVTAFGSGTDWQAQPEAIKPGDRILLSGPPGEHGAAVLLAREDFGFRGRLQSDCASLLPLVSALAEAELLAAVRFMRDPTRGGIATVCHELNRLTGTGCLLEQERIPVNDDVEALCDILGFDSAYLACEGRLVAIVDSDKTDDVINRLRQIPGAENSAVIGEMTSETDVLFRTTIGGTRYLAELEDEPLPRIC